MAITKVVGDFFDANHTGMHKAFGFGGSVDQAPGHPMGGEITRVTKRFDGSTVEHYSHGGKSVNHVGGVTTHHKKTGTLIPRPAAPPPLPPDDGSMQPAAMMPQGMDPDAAPPGMMPQGMSKGGAAHSDRKQDVRLIKQMVAEDDKRIGLARGGHARLPRSLKPVAARTRSPINTPPRNPKITRTPDDSMPGGVLPYGVQPSSEPGYRPITATADGPPNGLRKGGRPGK